MDRNSDYIFKAFIVNAKEYDNGNHETSGGWLYFPTTKENVSALFKEIGLPNNADSDQYFIEEYKCGNNDLEKFLSMDGDIDELNYLANRISELEDTEMTVFQSVIRTKECQNTMDAVNLTYNTECFDIVSDMGSWENIGAYIAEREGLGAGVLGDLSKFIDYGSYGRAYANDNGGFFLDDIYLERNSAALTEKYNGSVETIPPEYIVTESGKNLNYEIQLQASMELAIQIDSYLRRHNSEYVSKYTNPDEPPVYISDCLMNGNTLNIKDMLTETSTLQGDALVDRICDFEQKYPCNQYMLYQVKDGELTRDYRYASYNLLQKCGLSIDKNNYELTYICRLSDNTTLENLFEKFNINRPQDFKGHSMSVSDIVVLHRNGEDKAYYCDVSGFVEAPEFLKENYLENAEKQIEQNYNQIDGIINNEQPKNKTLTDLHFKNNTGIISIGNGSTNIMISQRMNTDTRIEKFSSNEPPKQGKSSIKEQLQQAKQEQDKQPPKPPQKPEPER